MQCHGEHVHAAVRGAGAVGCGAVSRATAQIVLSKSVQFFDTIGSLRNARIVVAVKKTGGITASDFLCILDKSPQIGTLSALRSPAAAIGKKCKEAFPYFSAGTFCLAPENGMDAQHDLQTGAGAFGKIAPSARRR